MVDKCCIPKCRTGLSDSVSPVKISKLAFVKAQSENVPEQMFQIDTLVDSLIEEESTLDERIIGNFEVIT